MRQDQTNDFAELIAAKLWGIWRNGWKLISQMDPFTFCIESFPNKCTIWEIFVSVYKTNFRWQKLIVMPKLLINCINIWERSEPLDRRNWEEDFNPFSSIYYLFCKLFFFSNGVTDGWNLWENGQVFSKKNMEFQVA